MAKPNYQHAKRQKEASRKARQLEKLQRKQARTDAAQPSAAGEPATTTDPGTTEVA